MSYRLVAARAGARVLRAPTWLRTVRAHPAVAGLRADRARTVLEVAEVLALAARTDSTAAPTWPVLIEASGYSRATVARVLAWLHTQRLLVTLENGSTEQFRPQPRPRRDRPAPVPVQGNRAAVYLLTEPLPEPALEPAAEPVPDGGEGDQGQDQSGHYGEDQSEHYGEDQSEHYVLSQVSIPALRLETPPGFSRSPVEDQPRTGARETPAENSPAAGAGLRAGLDDRGGARSGDLTAARSTTGSTPGEASGYRRGPRGTKGAQRAADLAAAAALRARSLDLRPLSEQAVRSIIRPHLATGWDVEDLVWGIDHEPDGTARTFTAGPPAAPAPGTGALAAEVAAERRRRGVVVDGGARPARAIAAPAAWLAARLAPWAGRPAPVAARRAQAAARAEAARAAAAARRAANAAAAATAVPPPPVMAQARAALRARRGI